MSKVSQLLNDVGAKVKAAVSQLPAEWQSLFNEAVSGIEQAANTTVTTEADQVPVVGPLAASLIVTQLDNAIADLTGAKEHFAKQAAAAS